MKPVPACAVLFIGGAFIFAFTAESPGDTAAVKKKAAPRAVAIKIDSVPARRVLRDFRGAYRLPGGTTERRAAYAGGLRNLVEKKDGLTIPVQVHRVSVDLLIRECGLVVRDTWETRYHRLETEWIFDGIIQTGSKEIGVPKKKIPVIEDPAALELIRSGLAAAHPGWDVHDVVIQKKSATWNRCTARYLFTTSVSIARRDDLTNTTSLYECIFRSTLDNPGNGWEYTGDVCVYRGKDRTDCFIGTMCRNLSTGTSLPAISDSEALAILRDAVTTDYGLKKGNVVIESFDIESRGVPEHFRSRIPFVVRAIVSVDELADAARDGTGAGTVKVRAVYECIVKARLDYSTGAGKWRGVLVSCCGEGNEECGLPCSFPDKGCKRLGEK